MIEIKKFDDIDMKSSLDAVQNIETTYDFLFPDDYKEFMIEFDGGKSVNHFIEYNSGNYSTQFAVRYFFSFISSSRYHSIKKGLEYLRQNRVLKGYFPIGNDSFGNLFCLSTNPSDYGHIYFWDHECEVEEGEEPYMDNMSLLCKSFTELINKKMDKNIPPIDPKDLEGAEVWIKPGSFIEKLIKEQNKNDK